MSRVGHRPVGVPKGVEVKVDKGRIRVKGPNGTLEGSIAPHTRISVGEGEVRVERASDEKPAKAAHGLMRALVRNMVIGVTDGFTRSLDIVGVGYRGEVKGKELSLSIGFSHPVRMEIPEGLVVRAEGPTRIVVTGADKQKVGQFAANLREVRPPDPYKGKGIRYSDERIRQKVGKTAGS